MRGFVDPFIPNPDQREPQVGPDHTEPKNGIAAFNSPKKCCNERKGEDQQHNGHKQDKGVNAIDPLQWL
jgi:hypothetical protein